MHGVLLERPVQDIPIKTKNRQNDAFLRELEGIGVQALFDPMESRKSAQTLRCNLNATD
jgi:hypothetical protein